MAHNRIIQYWQTFENHLKAIERWMPEEDYDWMILELELCEGYFPTCKMNANGALVHPSM